MNIIKIKLQCIVANTEERRIAMAKLEIAVEVADDNILGKVAKVEETRRAFNNAWADLMNCFTAKYDTVYGNPATVKETPASDGADVSNT